LVGILIVKWVIWAFALGSGTSGGVLAPLLMIGGALGGLESGIFPGMDWVLALLSMAAALGGTMRSPLTAIVFALELTHMLQHDVSSDGRGLCVLRFTVLTMKRSILTEKVSRRGFHLSREYSVDPLEAVFVRDVMRTNVIALSPQTTVSELSRFVHRHEKISQRLFPVLTSDRKLIGVVTHKQLLEWVRDGREGSIDRWIQKQACTASPLEPLRSVANRMAERGLTRMPVIDAEASGAFVGMVSLRDCFMRARKT
jgi:CBS domain-containing protein